MYFCIHQSLLMSLKLLIIRFSSIGDIVLTTPVIRCVHEQVKGVEIHYLTKKRYANILENNPYVSKVYSIEKDLNEVIPQLKKERYDHIIDLHKNLRSFRILFTLKRHFTTFNKLNFEKWLLVRFKINRLPNVHIVDRYLKTVSFLKVVNDKKGLDFFIPDTDRINITTDYSLLNNGFIAFVIGGNHDTKLFPADMVASTCKMLMLPVVLLGGKEDFERGEEVVNLTGRSVINLCGKLKLMQSASFVEQSTAVITNDTGLMHIAAAFKKPVVSIWGNTVPAFGMYPYMIEDSLSMIAEVKNLNCRPCSKLGYKKCPLGHFNCMRLQDINSIAGFTNKLSDKS